MKTLKLKCGDIVNKHGISYVKDLEPHISITGRKKRKCLFVCHCGKEFCSLLNDAIGKRTSCGCNKGNKPAVYKYGDLINGIMFIRTCGTRKYAQRGIFKCPLCGNEWESGVGNIQAGHTKSCCGIKRGWSKSQWEKLSDTATLYKVKIYNDTESFIKIGITTKSIRRRFVSIPYKYEIIKIIQGQSGYIFDLENRCKRIFKKYRYIPMLKFKGETECYNF